MTRILVTGGAGFIGSNLIDSLLAKGYHVRVIDNFSTGRREFVSLALRHPNFQLVEADLLDSKSVDKAMDGAEAVIHLAANADVRFGWENPRRDLEQNVLVTHNILEAMRHHDVSRLIFSSTGSVYGESPLIPTPEDAPFPVQTSLYGASKISAEGLISAYAESGLISATVFRFVSILGPRYTHGHVIDFVAQLTRDPSRLKVLGDGHQRKSYLHVHDCVSAVMHRLGAAVDFEILNLGTDSYCEVNDSIRWICERMGLNPSIDYSGGQRGWVGDNPFIFLDITRIRNLGWSPKFDIKSGVEDTVDWLLNNSWALPSAMLK